MRFESFPTYAQDFQTSEVFNFSQQTTYEKY